MPFQTGSERQSFFEKLLEALAGETGAERERIIILILDNAGWHTSFRLARGRGSGRNDFIADRPLASRRRAFTVLSRAHQGFEKT